ncbi:molybdopterin-dependent oxidoreductase, partial [Candidatus Dojkabacteria bacterium]|nr:molybdopterin-dependent oxidoreductase [Candidatus Dojkabacteria bacterium]
MLINKGFKPKRRQSDTDRDRLPPGQYLTDDFPVLSLGPTPEVSKDKWKLRVWGLCEETSLSWENLMKLPASNITKDIHCVTKWSKYDTNWKGVWLDEIIRLANVDDTASFLIAHSADGYTTNIPIDDVTDKKALIAYEYDGEDIEAGHGGPVRLVVPHLYFWKSAKWLDGL